MNTNISEEEKWVASDHISQLCDIFSATGKNIASARNKAERDILIAEHNASLERVKNALGKPEASEQTITPDVLDVLTRSQIEGCNLILPEGQLARPLYKAVNRALINAGGKWNRFAKAHVFPSDPRLKLGLALEKGVSFDEQKVYQSFYTPPALADEIAVMASVEGQRVLEPSAGNGALVAACRKFGATQVDCIEIREEERQSLIERGGTVTIADFLTIQPDRKYSRIVMNPPFTKNQDVKHVEYALRFLASGGRLVSVMAGNTQRPKFTKLVESLNASWREVEAGAFKQSGTNVKTVILTINFP